MTDHTEPREGDLRIWYIPQVPMEPFEKHIPFHGAATLEDAAELLNTIIEFSIFEFEHHVKPDYSDVAGISRFEDGEWCDLDESEWEER